MSVKDNEIENDEGKDDDIFKNFDINNNQNNEDDNEEEEDKYYHQLLKK